MPIYEYECTRCGCFEHSQSIHDPPLARCPKCKRKVQRLISASSFHLKGGGWYSDGYAKKAAADSSNASASEPKTSEAPASNGAKTAGKAADSPPAGKSKTKASGKAKPSPAPSTSSN